MTKFALDVRKIGKLAAEIGLAVAIAAFAIGTGIALAARHGGGVTADTMAVIMAATTADTTVVIMAAIGTAATTPPDPTFTSRLTLMPSYGGPARCYGPYDEGICGPPPSPGVPPVLRTLIRMTDSPGELHDKIVARDVVQWIALRRHFTTLYLRPREKRTLLV